MIRPVSVSYTETVPVVPPTTNIDSLTSGKTLMQAGVQSLCHWCLRLYRPYCWAYTRTRFVF